MELRARSPSSRESAWSASSAALSPLRRLLSSQPLNWHRDLPSLGRENTRFRNRELQLRPTVIFKKLCILKNVANGMYYNKGWLSKLSGQTCTSSWSVLNFGKMRLDYKQDESEAEDLKDMQWKANISSLHKRKL